MRLLDEGKSFVVTRRDEPVGELRPLRRRRLVESGVVLAAFAGAASLDAAAFSRDLDAFVDDSVELASASAFNG